MANSTEYARVHYAARKFLKSYCERCGASPDRLEAALRPETPAARLLLDTQINALYSLDISDYHTLCVPCHRIVDHVELRTRCRRGHEYTPENTSIKTDGSRRCLQCHRENEANRLKDPANLEAKRASQRAHRKPLTPEQRARKTALQRLRRQAGRAQGA